MKKRLIFLVFILLLVPVALAFSLQDFFNYFNDIIHAKDKLTTLAGGAPNGCSNECFPGGSRRCSGNGYQICGNYDTDSCLEWSGTTLCSSDQNCINAQCVSKPKYTLTTNKIGTGTGTITSNPTGINCGTDCTEAYTENTEITLTASEASGSIFSGWTGCGEEEENGATGFVTLGNTCTITLDSNKTITATFNLISQPNTYTLTVTKYGNGQGTVTGVRINCGTDCIESYTENTEVILTANALTGSTFIGWTNCGGEVQQLTGEVTSGNTCTTTIDQSKTITANFILNTQTGCTSECVNNQKRCFSNGYQICGNYDTDSCLEWSSTNYCGKNQICSQGNCINEVINEPPIGDDNKCSDNTLFNTCSLNKPLYCNNGILIEDCNICGCDNGVCLEDGSCALSDYETILNPDYLEEKPVIRYIPKFILSLNKQFVLNLNNYVYDLENRPIIIEFANRESIFSSNIIDCILNNNQLTCTPRLNGKITLNLIASNNIKDVDFYIELEIINEVLLTKDISTHNPIANAGQDIKVNVNSFFILDGSRSYDPDNDLLYNLFEWYEDEILLGYGSGVKLRYIEPRTHNIKLIVKDSSGLTNNDYVTVNVVKKTKCKNTNVIYYPEDTICNDKWPSEDGEEIIINSKEYSCNLVEVCDDSIDYIVEDAIDCCDNTLLSDEKKASSCNFANKYSNNDAKKCQALYLIKSLGADQVYMQDYFRAEMCCRGVQEICGNENYLYTKNPIPNTETNLENIKCYNIASNNPPGNWFSDVELEKNNIALADLPAHASLNQISSGTCVDYSFSITTLLRKTGYKQDEVLTVEAPNHAYNLVKFPLDKKYTIVDTTGNNEPPIVFGKTPFGYKYCENIKNCYNDNGQVLCPKLTEINGCENAKLSFFQETRFKGLEIAEKINEIINLFLEEIK